MESCNHIGGKHLVPGKNDSLEDTHKQAGNWRKLDLVREIPLEVTVILGKTELLLGTLFALNRGNIVALEQNAASPVEILINNRPVARGEVVLVEEQFGVRITELLAGY